MNEIIIKKIATFSHLQGNINISNVPIDLLPNVGEIVNIVLGDLVLQANFINANGYRINKVDIGLWLQENNIQVGNTFYIKITNKNTFSFYTNAQ